MRHAFNNQPHFAFENVNDLLLRCECAGIRLPGGERSEHLIHRVAVRDGPARDSRANFNRRILSFHGQNLTAGVRMTRMFWSDQSLRSGFVIAYDLSPATVRWQHAAMKTFTSLITIVFAALIATPSFAQTSGTSPAIGTAPVGAATAQLVSLILRR